MGSRGLAITIAVALPISAAAQFSALGQQGGGSGPAVLSGKPAVDVMPGARRGLGYPLRYGGLIRGTVAIYVAGQLLKEGQDFTVDYDGGVVYLSQQVRDSDSIRVSYRHDPAAKQKQSGSGMPLMTLNFGNDSSMTMLLGIGGAERMSDGRVLQSQNVGLKNSFKIGGGQMAGLFLVSDRTNALVSADSASPDMKRVARGNEGTDSLIMQKFGANLGGGLGFSADFQRVGTGFGAFGMLETAGIGAESAQQLEKEKGISRLGFGLTGGNPGKLALASSFKSIDDGKGRLQFHDYGLKGGPFEAFFTRRTIDPTFSRFGDIAEADRAQLQKEKGITRTAFGGSMKLGGASSLKFGDNAITAGNDGVFRRTFDFEAPWMKFGYAGQEISNGFVRANDLAEGERGQWAKERGFKRADWTMSLLGGKNAPKLDISSKRIGVGEQAFTAESVNAALGWASLEYWNRRPTAAFGRLDDLSAPEKDLFARQVVGVYEPGGAPNDNDRNWISHQTGMARNFMRATLAPSKGSQLTISQLNVNSQTGGLQNTKLSAASGTWKFDWNKTNIDQTFGRIGDLIERERNYYGNQSGFNRNDWSLAGKVGRAALNLDSLGISYADHNMARLRAALKYPGLEISGAVRNVADGFTRTNDINDGEHDFLTQLRGYRQSDVSFKFDGIKKFSIQGLLYDATNGIEDKHRYKRSLELGYKPDSRTFFGFRMNQHRLDGSEDQLFLNDVMQFAGSHDFGKFGVLAGYHERENRSGQENSAPGRTSDLIRYESKLSKNLSFATEQARTQFDDGGYESVQSYTIGWQLTKRFGISLKEVQVDRDGTKPDQRATNFGINYDFGHNLKLSYSFAKDLNTVVGGKHDTQWDLTPGSFGGFDIGGSYYEGGRYGDPLNMVGKLSIVNPKPFSLGILKDVKVQFGYDGQTQAGAWQRQQKVADISAKLLQTEVGVGVTRVLLPGHQFAEDRGVRMKLDPSGKKPLQLGVYYKVRTMPDGSKVAIRDFDFSYKLGSRFSINHTTDNFTEKSQQGSPLGTTLTPTMGRRWSADYKMSKATTLTMGFEDLSDLNQHTMGRKSDVSLSLFGDTASPVRLSFAVVQDERPNTGRRTRKEWQVGFDQTPGPNQTLSFSVGEVQWLDGLPEGEVPHRFLLNVDYQLRF